MGRPEVSSRLRILRVPRASGVLIALLAIIAVFAFTARGFFTWANLANICLQGSVLAIASMGMTLAILSGLIDLSIGAVVTLAGVATGLALHAGIAIALAIPAGIAVGGLCGLASGCLVAYLGFHHFIATFGMMGIAQGIALVVTDGSSVPGFDTPFRYLGDGVLLGIPVPIWIAGACLLTVSFLLYRTRFGSNLYAMGGSEQVARFSGINTARLKLMLYLASGLLAGIAGVVLTARMNSANPAAGMGYEFDAIAAVVVGGTPFSGGRGGVLGTMLGAAIISVLKNGLNLAGFSAPWQLTIIGAMITCAIIVDVLSSGRQQ